MPGYIFKLLVPTWSNKTSSLIKCFQQNLDIQKQGLGLLQNANYHNNIAFICEDHFDVSTDNTNPEV